MSNGHLDSANNGSDKLNGLIKKTMSVAYNGGVYHLVSYSDVTMDRGLCFPNACEDDRLPNLWLAITEKWITPTFLMDVSIM